MQAQSTAAARQRSLCHQYAEADFREAPKTMTGIRILTPQNGLPLTGIGDPCDPASRDIKRECCWATSQSNRRVLRREYPHGTSTGTSGPTSGPTLAVREHALHGGCLFILVVMQRRMRLTDQHHGADANPLRIASWSTGLHCYSTMKLRWFQEPRPANLTCRIRNLKPSLKINRQARSLALGANERLREVLQPSV
jgi:hypothetical protein